MNLLPPAAELKTMSSKFLLIPIVMLMACAPASYYQRQLKQLSPEQRQAYKVLKSSIEAVGTRAEIEQFEQISSTDSLALKKFEEDFWKKRDPNPFTPENERKKEFDDRLRIVQEKYAIDHYFRPWDDRGEVFLKFGAPVQKHVGTASRSRIPSIMNCPIGGKFVKRGGSTRISNVEPELTETWDYGGFGFTFFYDLVRGYTLPTEQVETWVSLQQTPLQYFYDYGKEELKYAIGLTPFLMRDTPNIYDIYLTINAPAKKLVTPSLDSIHYIWKVLVQDENYERLFTDSSEGVSYLSSAVDLDKLIALDQKELRLKAGTYILTSELVNSTGNKGGMLQTKVTLPPYTFPKEIELSKAILAKEIRPAESTDIKFVRNGLVIKPWVSSIFNFDEPFWMYFEIYNMPQDREGKSHFTVKYYLQDLLTDKKYLLAEKSLREAQRDFAMVQSFTDSLFQQAKISLKTGKDYVILAEIKDEVMGRKVQSLSVMFKFKKTS